MKIYKIENGKKVEVKVKKTKKAPTGRPTETKAQKDKRIWDEVKGMFNNLGKKVF